MQSTRLRRLRVGRVPPMTFMSFHPLSRLRRWFTTGQPLKRPTLFRTLGFPPRRGARVVESGGLEIRCAALRYRGFESHPLRRLPAHRGLIAAMCIWRGDRVAEGARLESVCTLTGYRGFESLSLRSPLQRRRPGPVRPTDAEPRQVRKEAAVRERPGRRGRLGLSWRGVSFFLDPVLYRRALPDGI